MIKKILILTPFYPPNIGGAETFAQGLAEEVSRCHNITVLTMQPLSSSLQAKSYEKFLYEKGSLTILRKKWWIKPSRIWSGVGLRNGLSVIPQMVFQLISVLIKERFQIVHAHGLLSGFVAVLLKRTFGVKVYITLLALYDFYQWKGIGRSVVKWIFKNCDMIFVEGGNGRADIMSLYYMNAKDHYADNVKMFNHWVDQEVFCPPMRRPMDKIRVLFIGRPIPEKGKHIVEEAEKLLSKDRYEFIYLENTPFEELPKHYQMADIVVVPSLYSEGFSRVVAEASSCGCILIVSNRGSLPEMVKDFGHVIEPNAGCLYKKLKELEGSHSPFIEDGTRYMKEKTIRYAKEHFSPKNSEVFLKAYESI